MNPYKVCERFYEDFFIWIRTKCVNALMMILLIWIRTNPYKVCAIMQQRGDQSRSRPSSPSPSSSLFSKTFLLFTRIQMHKEIFGGNYKELLTVGQIFCGLGLSRCKVLGLWTKVAIGTRWSEADKSQTTIMAQTSKITLKLVYLKYLIALVQNLEVERGQWETISNSSSKISISRSWNAPV